MEPGFVRGQSNNLPKVTMVMVFDFLANNPLHTSGEVREVKLSASTRESYGDDAIGYVQVQRQGQSCTVKARITPRHKVKSNRCTFVCNEETEHIISVFCEDCAVNQGGCKHAIALIMWLNRRTEEPSCTYVKCYWEKANLSTIGSNLKFIKTADLVRQISRRSKASKTNLPPTDGSFLKEVVEKSRKLNINSTLMLYNKSAEGPTLSIHSMACYYKRLDPQPNADSFIQYCKNHMAETDIKIIAHETKDRSKSNMWFELRYGRITASKLHEVAHCGKEDGVLVEYMLGAYTFKDTKVLSRGKTLEPKVREIVAAKQNIKIKKSGLILNKYFPLFGASPDGISEEYVVEIKCPISKNTVKNYVNDGEVTKKYLAQIQLQMLCAEKKKGLFCIAHEDFEVSNKVDIYTVYYNEEFVIDLMEKSLLFWKKNVFQKVLMI